MNKVEVWIIICLGMTFSMHSLQAQPYAIPWAETQPQWVFPLWFESSDGQKDTVYVAFDSAATPMLDTIFGESGVFIDTDSFNACIGNCNSNLKAFVWPEADYNVYINFTNATFPLKVGFDAKVYESSALPGNSSTVGPRAYGLFGHEGDVVACPIPPFQVRTVINMTNDDFIPAEGGDCTRDSLIILLNPGYSEYFTKLISTTSLTGPKEKKDCSFSSNETINISVFNIVGQQILNKQTYHQDIQRNISQLESGFYISVVTKDNNQCIRKIYK